MTDAQTIQQAMRAYRAAGDELRGRVVAVTGASSGIGKAVALAAAALGAELILLGRNLRQLEAVQDAIGSGGGRALIAPFDLERALAPDYDRLAVAISNSYGRLDGLVHCAAELGTLAPVDHYDVPAWYRVLHVNLTAAFALTQVLLPVLRESADASIVFSSCAVGREPRAYWGAYAVSKAAIESLSRVLAEENTRHPALRINTLDPGAARTTLRRAAFPSEELGATPEPASLVQPYLWLLGPASRGVSGQALTA